LQKRFPPATGAAVHSGPSVAEQIAEGLARIGFVRGETGSLAETFTRFLGITVMELRAQLQRRAAGFPAASYRYGRITFRDRGLRRHLKPPPEAKGQLTKVNSQDQRKAAGCILNRTRESKMEIPINNCYGVLRRPWTSLPRKSDLTCCRVTGNRLSLTIARA